ncbi:MAG TPA: ABC transporter ATP-binding protein [Verrucomicrobiae bacterium]|nr:ABC transporter ATP-binding protein [Verrucomicrobiae bacterium]
MASVVVDRLSKCFRGPAGEQVRAVHELSLAIADKELLVLVGPSGCGKTTTLRLVAGLETPSTGTVAIDGQIVNSLPPQHRNIGMVFQQPALYPHLTVSENLAFGLKIRHVPKTEIQSRVKEAMEMLGLNGAVDRLPMALSGGERQRVALGRALVRRPGLLLLDEPLSNLDAPLRARMRSELHRLHERLGATFIYVTHDQDEAMALGGRIVVLHQGTLQQVDTPQALYARPASLFVAGFIGSPPMNLFTGKIIRQGEVAIFQENADNDALTLALERTAGSGLPQQRDVVLGLRPEAIALAAQTPATGHPPKIVARVERLEMRGPDTYAYVERGNRGFTARVPASAGIVPNQAIHLVFDLCHAHFFDPANGSRIAS